MGTDALLNHRKESFHGGVVGASRASQEFTCAHAYSSLTLHHVHHGSSDGRRLPFVNYTLVPHPTLHLQVVEGFGMNIGKQLFMGLYEPRSDLDPRHFRNVRQQALTGGLIVPASPQNYTFTCHTHSGFLPHLHLWTHSMGSSPRGLQGGG